VCELPEKKFKRTILRKLSKIKLIQKGNPEKTYATESFNNRLDQGERTHELECRSLGLTQSEEKGKKKE
jgi:hypothetical protein